MSIEKLKENIKKHAKFLVQLTETDPFGEPIEKEACLLDDVFAEIDHFFKDKVVIDKDMLYLV